MIIFPAIDLRHGKCVRLLYGDPNQQTTYSDNPLAMAQTFVEAGAAWLHIVNLDGAFEDSAGAKQNHQAIQDILDNLDVSIQVGGGIRTATHIENWLELGVTRVILGTVAAENPAQVAGLIDRFGPDKIVVGIDAKAGKVATRGWQDLSELDAIRFGQEMRAMGVTHTVYTDISRDGALTGSNSAASKKMAEATKLRVIISGGVASLDDIHQAMAIKSEYPDYIEGVIIGRALYEGKFELSQALQIAKTSKNDSNLRSKPQSKTKKA